MSYDQNRNAVRDERGNVMLFSREPLPEIVQGDADRMRNLIDACPHQWTYRAGVIAFTAEDAPTPDQQRHVMDRFEELAFAGLEPDQRDILWVRHTHEGRVELHFVTPRMELESGRSLNIAPPGYQKHYDNLRDVLNKEHGWNDPLAPERSRETVSLIESVRRGEAREIIHDWILERIETGEIHDRQSMTAALQAAGFEIPRTGKNYLTVHDPESDERWRLKGELFREDWTRENTLERALERTAIQPSRSGSRLDAARIEELRERLQRSIEGRTQYHRARYARVHDREPTAIERSLGSDRAEHRSPAPDGPALLSNHERIHPSDHSDEFRRELVLGGFDDRPSPEREPLANGVSDQSDQQRQNPHMGRPATASDQLPERQGPDALLADRREGIGHDQHEGNGQRPSRAAFAAGNRIADIRRRIGEGIGALTRTIQSAGETLDRTDRTAVTGLGRLSEIAGRITGIVSERLSRLRDAFQRNDNERADRDAFSSAGHSAGQRNEATDTLIKRSPALGRDRS
ncbi:relaxase/mobilization nuclease domain-containing protein [Ochrobactrum sp. C6C9]|uniref:relaxase/mobilization nuclease domain-containing protein n=1 Tax=Ochrobactrum sp. C6C9 TaxID=2736662 RepID=UPI0035303259